MLKSGSRLVNLSSAGHRFSDVDLEDPGFEHTPYTEFGAYGRSKTANILFAVEFDRRHKGEGVRATAVHPGGIQTELGRYMTPEVTEAMIKSINAASATSGMPAFSWKTIPQGAATSVWAGVKASADEVGGKYCEDCHVADVVDTESFDMAAACAATPSMATMPRRCGPRARLWSASVSEDPEKESTS